MERKWLRKKLFLVSLLGATLVLSSCKNDGNEINNKPHTLINTAELLPCEEVKQIYNYDEIAEAIDNNPNIGDEEKEFLKNLKFVFDENHNYMDLDYVKNKLSTLKIIYSDESMKDVGGYYSRNDNQIVYLNSASFEDVDMNVFVHEFLHVLQPSSTYDFTVELSNEFFTREVVRRLYDEGIITEEQLIKINSEYGSQYKYGEDIVLKYGLGYDSYMPLYYAVAELNDESCDWLRKYQFSCKKEDLIFGVCGLLEDGDSYNMERFMDVLNSSRIYNKETNSYDLVNPFEENKYLTECAECLDYYYEKKLGYHMKEDLKTSILFYDTCSDGLLVGNNYSPYELEEDMVLDDFMKEKATEKASKDVDFFGYHRIVVPRSYLTKNHKNPVISFNSPEFVSIEITDDVNKELNDRLKELNKTLSLNH